MNDELGITIYDLLFSIPIAFFAKIFGTGYNSTIIIIIV